MTEPNIILTRGIPASGKSTWAKAWVAKDPANRIRLNRDDLRTMLGVKPGVFDYATEQIITKMQHDTAKAALKAGKSVVVDDTNLRAKYVREWFKVGPVIFNDFLVDLDTAIYRDASRSNPVGAKVITSFHERFVAPNGGQLPPIPIPQERSSRVVAYEPNTALPKAYIVDTDGTVARMNGRGPYDGHLVHTDLPIDNVVALVRDIHNRGHRVIGVSGRDGKYGEITKQWWRDNDIPFDEFYFRPEGDTRRDDIIKLEIFDQHIRNRFNVIGVLDDRNRVVQMWRELGLTTYQVADGDF